MSDAWPATPLGALVERMTTRNSEGNGNVLTISARHGLVSQRDYFNKTVASDNLSNYYLLTKGDFAYNKSYSDGYPVGAIKRLDQYASGVVSPLYICFRLRQTCQVASDFLVHFFESGLLDAGVRAIAKEGARNHGLLNVKVSDFFELLMPLPGLGEQRKIAAILSAVDEAIEATQAVIDQLQVVKKAMLTELLTRGLPGRHMRFKQTAIGEVPESWSVCRVGDILEESAYGTSAKCESGGDGLPVLRIPNVVAERISTEDLKFTALSDAEVDAYRLRAGDLLVIRTNGNPRYVGRTAVVPEHEGTWLYASYLIRLRVRMGLVIPSFLHEAMRSERARQTMQGAIRTSAGNYNLNTQGISNTQIPLPPLDEQAEITAASALYRERIDRETAYLVGLKMAKSAVMTVLLNGEVRVIPNEVTS